MQQPSDHVDADDPEAWAILEELVALVFAHEGRIDPDAVVVERNHELHLELRTDELPDRPILRVPPELLVPVADIEWTGEGLTPSGRPAHLSTAAAAALELMLELYRACRKVETFAATSPRVAAASDGRLAQALAATRRAGPESIVADPRTAFLDARVIDGRRIAEGPNGGSLLMPLLDVVDHDPEGAQFLSGPGGMALRCRRPLGDRRCFARYGPDRDPLDLAITYGFTSERSRVVNSAPVDVELGGEHRLRIRGTRHASERHPTIRPVDDGLVMDRLTFRADQPGSSRAEVTLAVRSWVLQRGGNERDADDLSEDVVARVVGANLDVLDRVGRAAADHPAPISSLIGRAVDLSVDRLRSCG
jgi:hypothetical protein